MATPDLTLVSESTLPAHLATTLTSAKGYADTKKNEAITAAATDATTKANAAKTDAIADATTKYGGLPNRVTELEENKLDIVTWRGTDIEITTHLDTITTPGGYYVDVDSKAALDRGFPVAKAGRLTVEPWNWGDTSLTQIYRPFRHEGFFVRFFSAGVPYAGTTGGGWMEYRTWKEVMAAINAAMATIIGRHLNVDEHIDTVKTAGAYYVDNDTEAILDLGFPVARSGRLEVGPFNFASSSQVQIYYPFRHAGYFIRYFYGGTPYTGAPYGTTNKGWAEYKTWAEVQKAIDAAIAGALQKARSSTTSVAFPGDSLTDGHSNGEAWDEADSYPAKVGAYLGAGVTVTNRGFSGATTDQINLRMGALPLEMKIPGGTIPASGAVALTSKQVIGAWGGTVAFNAYGYLEGIYGLLRYTELDGYTFTRSASGTEISATRATFIGEFKEYATDTIVYGAGRNDITKNTTGIEGNVVDHIMTGYAQIVKYATPRRSQLVLLGTITRTDENPDSDGFKAVQAVRERIRMLYPEYFLDLQGYLTGSDVWTHTGITPTTADLDAQALGMTPPSLFDDVTHYSRATAAAIGEHLVGPHLEQKGYV